MVGLGIGLGRGFGLGEALALAFDLSESVVLIGVGVMPTADPMGSQPWGRKSDPMGVKTPWGFSRGVPQKKNY